MRYGSLRRGRIRQIMNHPKDLALRRCRVARFNGRAYLCVQQAGVVVKGADPESDPAYFGFMPLGKSLARGVPVIRFTRTLGKKKPHCSGDSY